jgi:hypothetical protein
MEYKVTASGNTAYPFPSLSANGVSVHHADRYVRTPCVSNILGNLKCR